MWPFQAMKYHSTIKKNEILIHATPCWVKEARHKSHRLYDSIHGKQPEKANPQKVDLWLPGARGRRKWGVTANRYGIYSWGEWNVLQLDHGCTTF